MLKDSFYHITSLNHQDNTIMISLQFNSGNEIFAGHFPGQPVVPGACMLQMVKEILTEAFGANYQLKKADNLKFIAPVDPRIAEDTKMKISYKNLDADIQVNTQLSVNGVTCFKMQGIFIAI
jgi:3-hydroxyacyl-[acyl-carrier-protein] dehydratase